MPEEIQPTEEQVEEVTDEVTEPLPFLKITSMRPTADGRVDSLTVELHLNDGDPVGEYDPDRPGEREAANSWVLDLVTTTIRELRRNDPPPLITVAGTGVHAYLGDRITHSPDCKGDCGLPATRSSAAAEEPPTLGHPGSDRWTGGDRKDTN